MKKLEIKNFKKLQLWSMVKFVQCIDERYGAILNLDSECLFYLNDYEFYKFNRHEDNKVFVTYVNENPSFDYNYIKFQSLLEVNTMSQKLDIINLFLEAIHYGQDEPIIGCISGNEIYDTIKELACNIENAQPIYGFEF